MWKLLSMSFGALLREHRLSRRLSQGSLAERAGLSIESVSSLERGFRRMPQRYTIEALAKALELGDAEIETLRASIGPGAAPVPRRRTNHVSDITPAPVVDSLPHAATRLIGREAELATLGELLAREQVVIVAGAGGIGKTCLAIEAAWVHGAHHSGGMFFVDLSLARPGEAAIEAIAAVLGVALRGPEEASTQIARAIARFDALLVIDNCEHVNAHVSRTIGAIVAGAPSVKILATTREDLRVTGGATLRLSTLSETAAVELFAERARSQNSTFAITSDNAGDVAEICRRLDGIALAIELAATRMRSIGPRELRGLLSQRFAALSQGPSDRPSRQQTLAALVNWSYTLLSDRERECFDRLAVFGGRFTLEAVSVVVTDAGEDEFVALDLLDSLVSKSLVVRESADAYETRYVLLETMREFAAARLAERADRDGILKRFVEHVRSEISEYAAAFENDPRVSIFAPLVRDEANIFAALDAALELGEYASGAGILTLWHLMISVRHETEQARYARRFAQKLDARELALHARLSAIIAFTHSYASSAEAIEIFDRGLASARESGDISSTIFVLELRAVVAFRTGRLAEASAGVDTLEAIWVRSPRAQQRLRFLGALRATYAGDRKLAITLFSAFATAEALLGNEQNLAVALNGVAEAEHASGNTQAALDAIERSPRFVELRGITAIVLISNIAGYLAAVDRIEDARTVAVEAFTRVCAPGMYGTVFVHLILVCALEGHYAAAAALAGFLQTQYEPFSEGQFTEHTSLERSTRILGEHLTPEDERAFRTIGASFDFDRACALARDPASFSIKATRLPQMLKRP